MSRKKALLPFAYFISVAAAQSAWYPAVPAVKQLIALALFALAAAGAAATAREPGLTGASTFHLSALFAAFAAGLAVAVEAKGTGLFVGPLVPLAAALLALVALDRCRPSLLLKFAAGALAVMLPLVFPEAEAEFWLLLAAALLPLFLLDRLRSAPTRLRALAAYATLVALAGLPVVALVNRTGGRPCFFAESNGFHILFDPVMGAGVAPRVEDWSVRAPVTLADVGRGFTFMNRGPAGGPAPRPGLVAGRRWFEPEGIPGFADLVTGSNGGGEECAFVPDALGLYAGETALPFSERDRFGVHLRCGRLGLPYLAGLALAGETFAFPRHLVALAPTAAFARAGGGRIHVLDETVAEGRATYELRGIDAEGRPLYGAPVAFKPLGLEYGGGPILFGSVADPSAPGETFLLEFRDDSGEIAAGFSFPDRIHRVLPLPGTHTVTGSNTVTVSPAACLVFHGRTVSRVGRDGSVGPAFERSDDGPVAAAAADDRAAWYIDYYSGRPTRLALPALTPGTAEVAAADFLAASGGRLLAGDFETNALTLVAVGVATKLPTPYKNLRYLAPDAAGGFLVATEEALVRLDRDGREIARTEPPPLLPPDPLGDGFMAAEADAIRILDRDLRPVRRLAGTRNAR